MDDPPTWACASPLWVSRDDPQYTGSVGPGIPHSLRNCCPVFCPSLYRFLELQMLEDSRGEGDVTFMSSFSLEPSTEPTWPKTSILSWTHHSGVHSFNRSFNNCYYIASCFSFYTLKKLPTAFHPASPSCPSLGSHTHRESRLLPVFPPVPLPHIGSPHLS